MTRLEAGIEAIRARHAPDARLAAWDVRSGEGKWMDGWAPSAEALAELRTLAAETGAHFAVRPLPDPALGAAVRGAAHRAVAHLRREPSHASELVTQILLGEEVLVLRAEGEWLRVQAGDGYVAWVHRHSVVRDAPSDKDAFLRRIRSGDPEPGAWIVTGRGVVARAGPEPLDPPVAELVQGGRLVAAPVEDLRLEAIEILLPDGLAGWISSTAALPAARLEERFTRSGRAILDHAAQFLGSPYLWGGTSERGYDCSGLVQRIYGLHGVRLPRDSDQQSEVGEPIDPGSDWGSVQAGDLAFFSESGGRATHVGILAEGGRMLHCSTTRHGVAWDDLDAGDSEYGARLAAMCVGVRRVL
ncbi:MAG TPA: C40 family peptidase [Gemmatimonadota bacterium]|nr:C40 family peptidase [Gemmatimonadota bacterium]